MTIKDLERKVKAHEAELQRYIRRQLPVKIGAKAKSVFQENFRKGGFQDGPRFEAKSMMNLDSDMTKKQMKVAIENRIKKAKVQADNIILEIPDFFQKREIYKDIYSYMERTKHVRTILVKHKSKLLIFTKNETK